jgi:tetratricopeptide (TPR) repeat protein
MREGDAVNLAIVYALQIIARYYAGDFAGSEEHFTAGLRFFDKQFSRVSLGPIDAFGWASWNAWTIGRSETARKRVSQMRACANLSKPYDVVFSVWYDALHHILLREYEEAEPLATQALELSERHRFSTVFALSQGVLGYARAQLRHPDGLELIRQGLNASLQGGSRVGMMRYAMHLAEVQGREGCLADGLETVELALQRDSEVLAFRPEALRVRGELRLKQEEVDLAEADLRDAIALAQKLGAKA